MVKQRTKAPTQKVAAAGIGGAVATIVVLLYQTFTGNELPAGPEALIAAAVALAAGYLKEEKSHEPRSE